MDQDSGQDSDQDDTSSSVAFSAADVPVLDKLCSGITGRELFAKEEKGMVDQKKLSLRTERQEDGRSLNSAGIYQQAMKELWDSLSDEVQEGWNMKANLINNSDVIE